MLLRIEHPTSQRSYLIPLKLATATSALSSLNILLCITAYGYRSDIGARIRLVGMQLDKACAPTTSPRSWCKERTISPEDLARYVVSCTCQTSPVRRAQDPRARTGFCMVDFETGDDSVSLIPVLFPFWFFQSSSYSSFPLFFLHP